MRKSVRVAVSYGDDDDSIACILCCAFVRFVIHLYHSRSGRTSFLFRVISLLSFCSSSLLLSFFSSLLSQEVALMPKGSYLINASRGEVVKVAEVAAALRSGHLVCGGGWWVGC